MRDDKHFVSTASTEYSARTFTPLENKHMNVSKAHLLAGTQESIIYNTVSFSNGVKSVVLFYFI